MKFDLIARWMAYFQGHGQGQEVDNSGQIRWHICYQIQYVAPDIPSYTTYDLYKHI